MIHVKSCARGHLAPSSPTVRRATEAVLPEVADMVGGFVRGHPAERQPRSVHRLQEVYFGAEGRLGRSGI